MADAEAKKAPTELTFHYIKGTQFRVVHADGAVTGVTPSALIHLALFSERPAIPQQVTHEIVGDKLGKRIDSRTVSRGGVVREIDVDVLMTLASARAIHKVLGEKIEELQKLQTISGGGGQ